MLVAFFIFVALVAVCFLIAGVAIGRTGRDALRAEINRLREIHAAQKSALEITDRGYEDMKRIAAGALEAARQKHFPEEADNRFGSTRLEIPPSYGDSAARSMPDYIVPEAKNCPECFVSVRSETWPQECPACQTLFGDDWPDTIG